LALREAHAPFFPAGLLVFSLFKTDGVRLQ